MSWIIDNWIILLLLGGMLAFHMFGHNHGGKSKHGDGDGDGECDRGGGCCGGKAKPRDKKSAETDEAASDT